MTEKKPLRTEQLKEEKKVTKKANPIPSPPSMPLMTLASPTTIRIPSSSTTITIPPSPLIIKRAQQPPTKLTKEQKADDLNYKNDEIKTPSKDVIVKTQKHIPPELKTFKAEKSEPKAPKVPKTPSKKRHPIVPLLDLAIESPKNPAVTVSNPGTRRDDDSWDMFEQTPLQWQNFFPHISEDDENVNRAPHHISTDKVGSLKEVL